MSATPERPPLTAIAPSPLEGLKVIELCSTIAGPVCSRLLADFGADVLKIEPPTGDSVRNMGQHEDNISLYAASVLRNKKLIAIDLKKEKGRLLVLELLANADILIENFRPGTLEKLGMAPDDLLKINPRLIIVRISGYGQSGPYSSRPGYGAICEAMGGIRYLTGESDRPPARTAVAMTDEHTAALAAYGTLLAVIHRYKTGKGQVIDAALYEAAFSMMEMHVPAYDRLKTVPKRLGANLPSSAPNSIYPTNNGEYILIAANNDAIFKRLANVMGRPEMSSDPKYLTQRARAARMAELNEIVSEWTIKQESGDLERLLILHSIPVSRVYTVKDIFEDEHFRQRDMLVKMPHPKLGSLTVPGIVPKLSGSPGRINYLGGEIGRDTDGILKDRLHLTDEAIEALRKENIVF